MRLLLILLILGAMVSLPFAFLKRPWAVKLWRRVRMLFVVYVLIIVVSSIVSLIFRWDAIYG